MRYDDSLFRYVEDDDSSQVPNTRTLLGIYGPYRPPSEDRSPRDRETVLACIHHYDLRSLRAAVERLGFEVLTVDGADRFVSADRAFGIILLRKRVVPPESRGERSR